MPSFLPLQQDGAVVGNALPYGPLDERAVHLCMDMQCMFAEQTEWHVPWMQRVLPSVLRIARAWPERSIFTRFIPPQTAEDEAGAWRRYYERWRDFTRSRIDPRLLQLVPPVAALSPPATVFDKSRYSPFTGSNLHALLRQRGIDALVISGGETDVCVLAAVMDAVDLGYRVVLARDALCSVSDATHDALLRLYHDRFGQQIEVASVGTILAAWR